MSDTSEIYGNRNPAGVQLSTGDLRVIAEWMRDEGIGNAERVCYRLSSREEDDLIMRMVELAEFGDLDMYDDRGRGIWRSRAEYAEEMVNDLGYLPEGVPSWIAVDWDKTADNLRDDFLYTELPDGRVAVHWRHA